MTWVDARLVRPRVRAWLLVVAVLAVSSAILVRLADASAVALAWWRTALGALALAPFAVRTGIVPRRGQRPLLAASGMLLAAHFWLWFQSLAYTTVASSAVLVSMSPVLVGVGAARLLDEPPDRRTWTGVWITVLGAIVIVAGDVGGTQDRGLLGDLLALAASVAIAGYLLLGRHARRTLPASVYATWTYGSAALILLGAALVTGAQEGVAAPYDRGTWIAIAGLVVGPQLLGHTVFNLVMGHVTATVVAVVAICEPIGATMLAVVLLGETPGGWFLLGTRWRWWACCWSWAGRPGRRGQRPDVSQQPEHVVLVEELPQPVHEVERRQRAAVDPRHVGSVVARRCRTGRERPEVQDHVVGPVADALRNADELPDVNVQARLLAQLTAHGVGERLAGLHPAPWQRPAARADATTALHDEQAPFPHADGAHGDLGTRQVDPFRLDGHRSGGGRAPHGMPD
ncbi:MAG: DMT family transporter [Actinobacteria bacterium]|nr:DMT family transporter [Actinomycetota bacterium]